MNRDYNVRWGIAGDVILIDGRWARMGMALVAVALLDAGHA